MYGGKLGAIRNGNNKEEMTILQKALEKRHQEEGVYDNYFHSKPRAILRGK